MEKIKTQEQLEKIILELKNTGKKVVMANGCFDLLHVGHVRYLQSAKELGDVLVVAVNSDESVRTLKGKGRPFMPVMERMEVISALRCVDYVTTFSERNAEKILLLLKPDIHAKGTDYITPEGVPEAEVVKSYGGKTCLAGDPKNHSVTDIIKEVKRRFCDKG